MKFPKDTSSRFASYYCEICLYFAGFAQFQALNKENITILEEGTKNPLRNNHC